MTPEEFANCFAKERDSLLQLYFDADSRSDVARQIASLSGDAAQSTTLRKIVDGILRDVLYTVLLGLDGSASIGGTQRLYKLYDEDGTLLTGELESFAWERFRGPQKHM